MLLEDNKNYMNNHVDLKENQSRSKASCRPKMQIFYHAMHKEVRGNRSPGSFHAHQ